MDQTAGKKNKKKERDLDAEAAVWVTIGKLKLTQNNYSTFKRYLLFTQRDDCSSN